MSRFRACSTTSAIGVSPPFSNVGQTTSPEITGSGGKGRSVKLRILLEGGLYRIWVDDQGTPRPLLLPGETPTWAGGWAGIDGVGAYRWEDALKVLESFGFDPDLAPRLLDAWSAGGESPLRGARQQLRPFPHRE